MQSEERRKHKRNEAHEKSRSEKPYICATPSWLCLCLMEVDVDRVTRTPLIQNRRLRDDSRNPILQQD